MVLASASQAVGYAIEIAHAHGRGIVHRDLKPLSLFVQDDGPLKILDFSIARDLNATSSVTASGMGTPSYMAPEQWEGSPANPGMDLYALGCVLYELLTGEVPFRGRDCPRSFTSTSPWPRSRRATGTPRSPRP